MDEFVIEIVYCFSVPAYFETKIRNQTVRKGDDTILRCKGFGDPPMFIVWNRDAEPLDGKSRKRFIFYY